MNIYHVIASGFVRLEYTIEAESKKAAEKTVKELGPQKDAIEEWHEFDVEVVEKWHEFDIAKPCCKVEVVTEK